MTHILSHHADMGIAGHLLVDGIAQGIEKKGFRHGA
jgi:hypothetical protein